MVYLREVNIHDKDLLFKWTNDPLTRKNSFHMEAISYEDHTNWFNCMINRNDVVMYIMMNNDIPIGQIRINIFDDKAEISYSIAPEQRGNGYGRKIINLLIKKVKEEMPKIKALIAEVKPNNIASRTVFERESFVMKSITYELDVSSNNID